MTRYFQGLLNATRRSLLTKNSDVDLESKADLQTHLFHQIKERIYRLKTVLLVLPLQPSAHICLLFFTVWHPQFIVHYCWYIQRAGVAVINSIKLL